MFAAPRLRLLHHTGIPQLRSIRTLIPALLLTLLAAQPAWALRFGDVGNSPVDDPGWPAGAEEIFNVSQRVAYWEHNGRWHSDCRGDAEAFNKVLAGFALIEADRKQLIVHDGVGQSYWVDAVNKDLDADVDWILAVHQAAIWRQWQAIGRAGAEAGDPVPQLKAYVGGNIDWDDVVIPEGIEVVDMRLEAHGFTLADGNVIEGTVRDRVTGEPLAANMRLVRLDRKEEGGYDYITVESVTCDEQGHWVFTSVPAGQYQINLSADGYSPQMAGYANLSDQPSWSDHNAELAPAVALSGIVADEDGNPLEGVDVRLSGGSYDGRVQTDEDGRFVADQVPAGTINVRTYKEGYVRVGLGADVEAPAEDVELEMVRSARVEIVVDFGDAAKPESYLVSIEPEGGLEVGTWGGSANVDASGFKSFENIPPGTYVLWGRPNPGSDDEQTEKVTVELVGGETIEVALEAR